MVRARVLPLLPRGGAPETESVSSEILFKNESEKESLSGKMLKMRAYTVRAKIQTLDGQIRAIAGNGNRLVQEHNELTAPTAALDRYRLSKQIDLYRERLDKVGENSDC